MDNNWIELSINTTTVVGEIIADFLVELGSKGVVLGEWDPEQELSQYTKVKAYFPEEIPNITEITEKIIDKLASYKELDINIGAGEILTKVIKEEDWANSWKQYFHVLRVGEKLVIKPLWEDYEPKEDDLVINIDPGMAFGTGAHPSTQLCMEEIERIFSSKEFDRETYNILDLGTGSGILAITLNLLGYKKITAVDIDPVAVKASKENFTMNNMLHIDLFQGVLDDCNDQYDFIAGNILAEIIESLAVGISQKLKKGGLFMGSGIINHKEKDVIKALTDAGLTFIDKKYQGDWVLVNFKK
ncbi:MAG: 50S ribosomal protein L11 methyltransferase [Candidatus Sericytochromatia bacterium]